MTEGIKDKVVVITGASSGLGEATARHLANAGAKLVPGARRIDRLQALARELSLGESAAVRTDVVDRAQVQALVDRAVQRHGRIAIGKRKLPPGALWRSFLRSIAGKPASSLLCSGAIRRLARPPACCGDAGVAVRRPCCNQIHCRPREAVPRLSRLHGPGMRVGKWRGTEPRVHVFVAVLARWSNYTYAEARWSESRRGHQRDNIASHVCYPYYEV